MEMKMENPGGVDIPENVMDTCRVLIKAVSERRIALGCYTNPEDPRCKHWVVAYITPAGDRVPLLLAPTNKSVIELCKEIDVLRSGSAVAPVEMDPDYKGVRN